MNILLIAAFLLWAQIENIGASNDTLNDTKCISLLRLFAENWPQTDFATQLKQEKETNEKLKAENQKLKAMVEERQLQDKKKDLQIRELQKTVKVLTATAERCENQNQQLQSEIATKARSLSKKSTQIAELVKKIEEEQMLSANSRILQRENTEMKSKFQTLQNEHTILSQKLNETQKQNNNIQVVLENVTSRIVFHQIGDFLKFQTKQNTFKKYNNTMVKVLDILYSVEIIQKYSELNKHNNHSNYTFLANRNELFETDLIDLIPIWHPTCISKYIEYKKIPLKQRETHYVGNHGLIATQDFKIGDLLIAWKRTPHPKLNASIYHNPQEINYFFEHYYNDFWMTAKTKKGKKHVLIIPSSHSVIALTPVMTKSFDDNVIKIITKQHIFLFASSAIKGGTYLKWGRAQYDLQSSEFYLSDLEGRVLKSYETDTPMQSMREFIAGYHIHRLNPLLLHNLMSSESKASMPDYDPNVLSIARRMIENKERMKEEFLDTEIRMGNMKLLPMNFV